MEAAKEIGQILATIFCTAIFWLVWNEAWDGLKSQPKYADVKGPVTFLFIVALIAWKWGV